MALIEPVTMEPYQIMGFQQNRTATEGRALLDYLYFSEYQKGKAYYHEHPFLLEPLQTIVALYSLFR